MPTIQLIHGDALEWLLRLEAASVDMIFADPPYNLSGDGFLTCRSGRPQKCDKGALDKVEDLHAFNRQWIAECVRVLKDEGTLWFEDGSRIVHSSSVRSVS